MCKRCIEVQKQFSDYVYCPYCGKQLNSLFNVKKDDFTELINQYTDNEKTKKMILMFIDMRIKNKKKPTDHALKMILDKVFKDWKYNDLEAKNTFEKSLVNSWTDVYKINSNNLKIPKLNYGFKNETDYNDVYKF